MNILAVSRNSADNLLLSRPSKEQCEASAPSVRLLMNVLLRDPNIEARRDAERELFGEEIRP